MTDHQPSEDVAELIARLLRRIAKLEQALRHIEKEDSRERPDGLHRGYYAVLAHAGLDEDDWGGLDAE